MDGKIITAGGLERVAGAVVVVPTVKWLWYVFGKGPGNNHLMVVSLTWTPPWWQRVLCRVLLRSAFERTNEGLTK